MYPTHDAADEHLPDYPPIVAQSSFEEEEEEWHGPVLYLGEIKNKAGVGSQLFSTFESKIKEGLNYCKRVSVIDASTESVLQQESQRRNSGAAVSSSSLFDRMKSLGANYIIQASLESENTKYTVPEKSSDTVGKFLSALGGTDPYYTATLGWTISVVSVKKGTVIYSNTYTTEGTSSGKDCKSDEARIKATENVFGDAYRVAKGLSVVSGEILKVESMNRRNTKAETVIINLGSYKKLNTYEYLNVYVMRDVAGEKTKTKVGQIRVKEVLSPNRSICEVKDGEKEILEYTKKGTTLMVRTL